MTVVAYRGTREVVTVIGPDAFSYLQSQVSQDISGIGSTKCMQSLILDPTGKVDVLARITYLATDNFEVDIESGFGDALVARLKRFKIRVKAELELHQVEVLSLRGDEAAAFYDSTHPAARLGWWMDGRAVDLFGVESPDGVEHIDAVTFDALRVAAGWPAMGKEVTPGVLAAELGVESVAVGFGKGCYPGQELVERMASRNATAPRMLCRMPAGVSAAGVEVTSSAGKWCLGFVKRAVDRTVISADPVSASLR